MGYEVLRVPSQLTLKILILGKYADTDKINVQSSGRGEMR